MVVLSERMDKCVLQARLVIDLVFKARGRPRGVINGRMAESVVHDQRPAGSAVVVLPQPGRQPVEIQQPGRLLVPGEALVIEFRKRRLRILSRHFRTLVPDLGVVPDRGAAVLNNVGKGCGFLGLGGRWSVRTKYSS